MFPVRLLPMSPVRTHKASNRDLTLLIAPTNPDRIELGKGLQRWAHESYWLDDKFTDTAPGTQPESWRLVRPNAVNAAPGACHDVLRSLDRYVLTKNGAEDFHFRIAKLGAHFGRSGDRAVVLDQ
ncbi:MAG: hypothetical protein ACI9NC_005365 [Verrucomicrobiales bacterium]|jgi:hypothetical protein